VLNMMHGLLATNRVVVVTRKVGVGLVEERKTKTGGTMVYRVNDFEFDFCAVDGSKVTVGPVPGEGADTGDKAANKTMANAYKYAMFLTFSIPTQGLIEEPDDSSPEAGQSTNGGHTEQQSSQTGGENGGNGTQQTPGDYTQLRKKLDTLLAQGGFEEKEVKQAKAMASKINPRDTKSLENLIVAWERKKSAGKSGTQPSPQQNMSPEQVADAVQGTLFEGSADIDDFDDDIPF